MACIRPSKRLSGAIGPGGVWDGLRTKDVRVVASVANEPNVFYAHYKTN